MPVADKVTVELEAKIQGYMRDMRRASADFDQQTGKMAAAQERLEREMRASSERIGGTMKGLAGSLAGYFTGRELVGMIDAFTQFENKLRIAGVAAADMQAVQERLMGSAQKYGVEIGALGGLFGTLTNASKELGASQEQVFKLTDSVSAALKISGMSATEASGALLQLGQSLRGGKVQAEEYNSLLDGMYPLLEAAARGNDKWGGSVAKMTAQVKDGKVSSSEFFNAILAGSAQLEAQAAKSTDTLSQAVTKLSNELTMYIGAADKANGVSAAISSAIGALADNLDTIIPILASIGVALMGSYVGGLLEGAVAAGRNAVAMAAKEVADKRATAAVTALGIAQARTNGVMMTVGPAAASSAVGVTRAATAMTLLRGAGAGVVGLLGGPWGIAVTAAAVGIAYFASKSAEAKAAADNLEASLTAQEAKFAHLLDKKRQAAAEADNLTKKERAAITETAKLTNEAGLLAEAWGRVAAQAKEAALEQAKAARLTAYNNMVAADDDLSGAQETAFQKAARRPFAERGLGANAPAINAAEALAATSKDAEVIAAKDKFIRAADVFKVASEELEKVTKTKLGEYKPNPSTPVASDKKDTKSETRTNAQIWADFKTELAKRGIVQADGRTGFRSAKDQNEIYRSGASPLDGYKKLSRHQTYEAFDPTRASHDDNKAREAAQAAGLKNFEIVTESGGRKHYEWRGAGKRGEIDIEASERAQEDAARAEKERLEAAKRSREAMEQYTVQLQQLSADVELEAAEQSGDLDAIAEAKKKRIDADLAAANLQTDHNNEIGDAQKLERYALDAKIAGLQKDLVDKEKQQELDRRALETKQAIADADEALLEAQARNASTRKEALEIELRLLKLRQDRERFEQEEFIKAQIRAKAMTEAEAAALRAKQAAVHDGEQDAVKNGLLSPGQAYLAQLTKDAAEVNDRLEEIAAGGLRSISSGIADAIVSGEDLGDVLENAGKRALAAFIDLAFQLAVIKPMMESLSDGAKNGTGVGGFLAGIGNAIGGLFGGGKAGKATGGPAVGWTKVGENGEEWVNFGGRPAWVTAQQNVPKLAGAGGGQAGGTVRIIVEEGPNFASTVRAEATGVSVQVVRAASGQIIEGAVNETMRRSGRPKM